MENCVDEITAIHYLKKGDFGGLKYLMERYQVKATRAAFLIMRDKDRAEDVVQEVFLRFFQRPSHFDNTRPFEPYLMRSVINAAFNACRNEKRSISLEGNIELVERLVSQAVLVESQAEYSQLKSEIMDALGKLPPRQRAVIVQRYYLNMSEKEMAFALGVAPGTIKWLLNSARMSLRGLLERKGSENE
jgi:RNA polymerase sigma-70 factor (ECF subfamily)